MLFGLGRKTSIFQILEGSGCQFIVEGAILGPSRERDGAPKSAQDRPMWPKCSKYCIESTCVLLRAGPLFGAFWAAILEAIWLTLGHFGAAWGSFAAMLVALFCGPISKATKREFLGQGPPAGPILGNTAARGRTSGDLVKPHILRKA